MGGDSGWAGREGRMILLSHLETWESGTGQELESRDHSLIAKWALWFLFSALALVMTTERLHDCSGSVGSRTPVSPSQGLDRQ